MRLNFQLWLLACLVVEIIPIITCGVRKFCLEVGWLDPFLNQEIQLIMSLLLMNFAVNNASIVSFYKENTDRDSANWFISHLLTNEIKEDNKN